MATKFDRPFLNRNTYDKVQIGNLFNLASTFDLEGLRRITLENKIPLNVVDNNNNNLIHIIIRTDSETLEIKRLKINIRRVLGC